MANFEYIALDAKGEETTGSIKANDEADAISQLRKQGLYPTQVAAAGKGGVSSAAKRKAKKGGTHNTFGGEYSRKKNLLLLAFSGTWRFLFCDDRGPGCSMESTGSMIGGGRGK